MRISKQARREAKHLFQRVLVDGTLDEARVRQTVQRVLELKPRGYLAILHHFQRLLRLELTRRTALVESEVTLSSDWQSRIRENLARLYGPGLNLTFAEKPGLLGGLRVQVGSDVYDGTILARLKELEHSF